MDFVDRVLSLQGNSPIRKFSLKCETGVSPAHVNRWLCEVLQRGVLELDLTVDLGYGYYMPQDLFVSETLVNLKLKSAFGIHWWTGAEGTSLPMLKTLCVYSPRFFCDDKLEEFLPSFPVLEDLQMSNIQWIDSDETVSSSTLTTLHITCIRSENPKSISFDTPNLLSFVYSDYVAEDYPLVNMKNLSFARIALRVDDYQIKRVRAQNNDLLEHDVVLHFGNVVKLMNGIQNVQELHLCPDILEVLSLCCDSMPVFHNVKKLLIYSDKGRGWQAVPVLLRNCPHLEILIFEGIVHHVTDKCGDACDCIYRKEKGRSLRSCPVKVVEIKDFGVTMKEKHMIEHFLDYFSCLKEMKIYVEEDGITQIMNNPEVSKLVLDEMEEYNDLYSCNFKLYLDKKSIRNL
ncbi:hypothetical protein CARUB_v10013870mg [Capsella rubella]|uniref:FBD domain-containing protein n=2 Tax=Capsella rubella TaxID=81985 RepID=R0G5B2_9BRAS|nr:hypothetical protein CARUB_v10013870mg [Capsella rubella]EOA30732.1 hypothetical protein CARUB_v10013870mg [Capsella rubella]